MSAAWLVMFKDPEGMPRAWAQGPTVASALACADQHLAAYREAKREVGDTYLAECAYKQEVKEL